MDKLDQIFSRIWEIIFVPIWKWAKRTSFIGLDGIPIADILARIYQEIIKDDITVRANSMAFSFLLAFFPILILIFSIIPFLPNQNLEFYFDYINNIISQFLPQESAAFLLETLEDILFRPRTGLLSFSIFLALYFASNGIMYMMIGFEKQYEDAFKQRTYFYRRFVSVFITLVLGIMFFASSVLIFFSNSAISRLAEFMHFENYSNFIIGSKWLIIVFLIYSVISTIYRFGTNFKTKYGYFSPGATTATFLSILSSLIFSYYVNNFSNYNQIYGSIGALIITMLWLQINSFIILFGFELNASIILNKFSKEKSQNS